MLVTTEVRDECYHDTLSTEKTGSLVQLNNIDPCYLDCFQESQADKVADFERPLTCHRPQHHRQHWISPQLCQHCSPPCSHHCKLKISPQLCQHCLPPCSHHCQLQISPQLHRHCPPPYHQLFQRPLTYHQPRQRLPTCHQPLHHHSPLSCRHCLLPRNHSASYLSTSTFLSTNLYWSSLSAPALTPFTSYRIPWKLSKPFFFRTNTYKLLTNRSSDFWNSIAIRVVEPAQSFE